MPSAQMRKPGIVAALIIATATIVAALIGLYPHFAKQHSSAVIAGIVQEQGSKKAIGQASITLAGRTEQYLTDDNGNFRIDLAADAPSRVRLHVTKPGFQPVDIAAEPAENLVLQMRRQ